MSKLYRESDVPNEGLSDKQIVVVGYGSQGRGQALNLRDSGANVRVALREDGPSWQQAVSDGWQPISMEDAATWADVVCFLVPDMAHPEIYRQHFAGKMKPGATVLFSHGFNVHYQFIVFPEDVNVVMVAPKGPGAMVRREFENGSGVPCLIAIHADPSGNSFETALAYADAIGGTRAGVLKTSFAEETETDLFGEQAVLCGGVTELVVAGWETLVHAGYSPEIAYFECMHEMKLIVDLLYEGGISRMHQFISDTASYGDLTRGKRVIDTHVREAMKQLLQEIQDGTFARQWRAEYEGGSRTYRDLKEKDRIHPIESTGQKLRQQFSWLKETSTTSNQPEGREIMEGANT